MAAPPRPAAAGAHDRPRGRATPSSSSPTTSSAASGTTCHRPARAPDRGRARRVGPGTRIPALLVSARCRAPAWTTRRTTRPRSSRPSSTACGWRRCPAATPGRRPAQRIAGGPRLIPDLFGRLRQCHQSPLPRRAQQVERRRVRGAIGGVAGAALAGHRGPRAAAVGTLAGAVGLGASEAVARARQRPGEIPALWQRIAISAALAAPLGWAAGRLTGAGRSPSAR